MVLLAGELVLGPAIGGIGGLTAGGGKEWKGIPGGGPIEPGCL